LTAEEIVENQFISEAHRLSEEARLAYRDRWSGLQVENSALRVVGADMELHSAPITFFDEILVSLIKFQGRSPAAQIVGEVLASFIDLKRRVTSDLVLAGRLAALADDGRIEATGDLPQLQGSQVRLPAD